MKAYLNVKYESNELDYTLDVSLFLFISLYLFYLFMWLLNDLSNAYVDAGLLIGLDKVYVKQRGNGVFIDDVSLMSLLVNAWFMTSKTFHLNFPWIFKSTVINTATRAHQTMLRLMKEKFHTGAWMWWLIKLLHAPLNRYW